MRRANNNPKVIIGITTVAVTAVTIVCVFSLINPFGKKQVVEGKTVEAEVTLSAPNEPVGSKAVEITTPKEKTLNQEEKTSKISASRQSSLEKAIDDLITLTESDG